MPPPAGLRLDSIPSPPRPPPPVRHPLPVRDAAPVAAPPAVSAAAREEARPWRRLADRLGVVHLDRILPDPAPASAPPPDPEVFRRAHAVLVGEGDGAMLVTAPQPDEIPAIEDFLRRHPEERRRLAIATPREIRRALIERHQATLVRRAVRAILDRDPTASAAGAVSILQIAAILLFVVAWAVAVADLSRSMLAVWTALFLGIGVLRAALAEWTVDAPVAPPVADADLPRFAVLVPLFREAEVVADLVAALLRLDYPADRLDLRLVVEADDVETRVAAEAAVAGTPVEIIAVPPAAPRTKPKALNFAFACVDAPFVTIFDAEDRPDPDQLRKAAAAFRIGGPDLAVVQAALEIDHHDDARPWAVRQFEIEYAVLFHGLLPWLSRHGLFLPLGGTSNHFRASHPLLPQENDEAVSHVFPIR